ncbi:GMP synthase [Alphaproteobacteria bacterium]|jgi:GMP synthase-like glutamine amidotransferase|nr:GMP synthase [Alphaproteobacteria bacterium]
MKIAILETGRINDAIADQFDRYPEMFAALFEQVGPEKNFSGVKGADFTFTTVPVIDGVFPSDIQAYDGYLVTGSAAGVYNDYDWIAPLQDLLRDIHAANLPLVGVCFGHQVIAHALGGKAEKWHDGWGVGPYQVRLNSPPPWLRPRDLGSRDRGGSPSDEVRLIHIHQDQVVALPPGATHFGSTSFCENAMFYIGDNVFCMQGHPEFTPDYTKALMEVREFSMGSDRVESALEGLKTEHEGVTIAGWILQFFANHRARYKT